MTEKVFYRIDGADINVYPVKNLLKATPFIKDKHINFNRKLKEDFFFKKFYSERRNKGLSGIIAENDRFDKDVYTYLLNIKDPTSQISLLNIRGYGGCGKTTYVHHLISDELSKPEYSSTEFEYVVLDFENENQVVTPIERSINRLLLDNYTVIYNFFKKILANNGDYDISSFGQYPNYTRYSSILLHYVNILYRNKSQYLSSGRISSRHLESVHMWLLSTNSNVSSQDNYAIYLHFLLTTLFLIKLHLRRINKNKNTLLFVLDNVDSIDNINEERVMLNVMHSFTGECIAFFDANINDTVLNNTKFIWILTTRIITSRYYSILAPDLEHQDYWHQLTMPEYYYDHMDILKRKIEYYLQQENSNNTTVTKTLLTISEFAEAVYKSNVFQKLYNGNIRRCIDALCSLCCDDSLLPQIEQVIELKGKSHSVNDEPSNGANGYILSMLLNRFKSNSIYENKLHLSTCAQNNTISLSRLVLTILRESPNECCSMIDIFEQLPDEYLNQELFDTIYDLSEAYRGIWRRLIILDSLSDKPSQSLSEEYNLYKLNHDYSREKYTNLSLCRAGKAYLDFIVPHFEFMLTRHHESYKSTPLNNILLLPLFDKSSTNKTRRKYNFEIKIDHVFNDVKDCCKNIDYFAEQVMKSKTMDRWDFMNKTRLNYSALSNADGESINYHQCYGARLVFNHVGYIEWYRRYLLKTTSDENLKIEYNQSLTERLKTYIELYTKFEPALRNRFQDHAAEEMLEAIEVIQQSSYTDFDTRIELGAIKHD